MSSVSSSTGDPSPDARVGLIRAAVLTVSDHLITQIETTSEERERSFDDMVVVALEALAKDAA